MPNLSFNEPAGVLVKTTLVDFPGRVAGSFFLKGCNLRCPYCYNTELITGNAGDDTINELFAHLEKRQGILTGIVISGGEPLLNPYTKEIILKAKEHEYASLPKGIKSRFEKNRIFSSFFGSRIFVKIWIFFSPHSFFFSLSR